MRIWPTRRPLFSHAPFAGQGASVYLGTTLPLVYRRTKIIPNAPFLRQGTTVDVGATPIAKTTRVASDTGIASDDLSLPLDLTAYAPGDVFLDVRHFRDDVEREVEHPQRVTIDGDGEPVRSIDGVAQLISYEARAGGVVRFRFRYAASDQGDVPESFELVRVSGPTSPSAVSVTAYPEVSGVYEIDSVALDDSGPYEFRIDAVIAEVVDPSAAEVRSALLTIEDVQADDTGPPAVLNLAVEVV